MKKLIVVEVGTGVDLQGSDATKAATRAVRDAIGRNYLAGVGYFMTDPKDRMKVVARLGVPAAAGPLDEAAVKAAFPRGEVTLVVEPGGLLAPVPTVKDGAICMVNAAVEVWVERTA